MYDGAFIQQLSNKFVDSDIVLPVKLIEQIQQTLEITRTVMLSGPSTPDLDDSRSKWSPIKTWN
jgi:hypothetical protein